MSTLQQVVPVVVKPEGSPTSPVSVKEAVGSPATYCTRTPASEVNPRYHQYPLRRHLTRIQTDPCAVRTIDGDVLRGWNPQFRHMQFTMRLSVCQALS